MLLIQSKFVVTLLALLTVAGATLPCEAVLQFSAPSAKVSVAGTVFATHPEPPSAPCSLSLLLLSVLLTVTWRPDSALI